MNAIEVIICLLLLFMAVPDLCRKVGRPALVYPAFVLFGLLLGAVAGGRVKSMLEQAGEVGFLLLLFEVGLEIELSKPRELMAPLRKSIFWCLIQYPIILGLATIAGFNVTEAFIAAAALTACSVGMSYPAWKTYPLGPDARHLLLQMMVLLEILAIILLSVETVILQKGVSWWVPVKLLGIGLTVFLIARFATHITRLFQTILERTTHWRMHFLVLLVLGVCAVGERLGLSSAKTAFALGLFLSRIEHQGKGLEQYMAPISHRFLIPVFFVALGLQIHWTLLFSNTALTAFGAAGLVLGLRQFLHRRWMKIGGDAGAFLLLCPNLTIVALATNALLMQGSKSEVASWLLLAGLFLTVLSIVLIPKRE